MITKITEYEETNDLKENLLKMVNLFQMNQKMKIMKIDGIPKIIMKV